MTHQLLQISLDAMEYHTAQTRPIQQTLDAMAKLIAALALPEQPDDDEDCWKCGESGGTSCGDPKCGLLCEEQQCVTDEQIKAVFLANGFTVKEGQTDLKPYVYAAARALLASAQPASADHIGEADEKVAASEDEPFGFWIDMPSLGGKQFVLASEAAPEHLMRAESVVELYTRATPAPASEDVRNAVLKSAVANLVKVKGRHHTEQAYQRLVAAYEAIERAGEK